MEDLLIAIVSSVLGAVSGGVAGWLVGRKRARSDRAWEIAYAVSEVQGHILSASTPKTVRTEADIDKLQQDWHIAHRRFYILGHKKAAESLTQFINAYLESLRYFVREDLSPTALEEQRQHTRDRVTNIMAEFANG